jgi:hypothetical protein
VEHFFQKCWKPLVWTGLLLFSVSPAYCYYNLGAFWRTPTIQFVQTVSNYGTASTQSAAFTQNNRAGDTIVVWACFGGNGVSWQTPSDTQGNIYYSVIYPVNWNGGGSYCQMVYAPNIKAGANTVTMTQIGGPATYTQVTASEFSGIDPGAPLDMITFATATASTNPHTSAVTTNTPNELIFGANQDNSVTATAATSFTPVTMPVSYGSMNEYKLAPTTGSYSTTSTASSQGWVAMEATFRPKQAIEPDGFVQMAQHALGTMATTNPMTFPSNNTAGNLIIVVTTVCTTNGPTISVGDSRNTYATAINSVSWDGILTKMFYAKNIGAGANTVTVTLSSTPSGSCFEAHAYEFSGRNTTAPLDVTNSASGNSTSWSASVTTTGTNELIFAFGDTETAGDANPAAGYYRRSALFTTGCVAQDTIAATAATYTPATTSLDAAGQWVFLVAAFK